AGVTAIVNILLNWSLRLVDVRFQFSRIRPFLNVNSMFSHIFALSISIGKTLSVTTRYTTICFMHKKNEIAKAFATCGYFCFFITTVPICVLSVLKLRREKIKVSLKCLIFLIYIRSLL
ncbi:hypothetical protein PENTCL1PPCAC_21332, partial [Pristionchus entomophagus]